MDGNIILIGTYKDVQQTLVVINEVAASYWKGRGYTVVDTPKGKAVVSKNADTGEDMPNSLTMTWDEASPLNETEWYIADPAGTEEFMYWRDKIPEGITIRTRVGTKQ